MTRRMAATAGVVLAIALSGCSNDRDERAESPSGPATTVPQPAAPVVEGSGEASPLAATPVAVSERVKRGERATAAFRSRPGTSCQIEVRYQDEADAQRLPVAVADPEGAVSWTWTVDPGVDPGAATAFVVCSGGSRGEARITVT